MDDGSVDDVQPSVTDYEVELGRRLRGCDVSAEELAEVAQFLIPFGVRVLKGWVRTGVILEKVRGNVAFNVPGPPPRLEVAVRRALSDHDAAQDLATDAVLAAWPRFRDRELVGGHWDARRSSLATYFVGASLQAFPNVWRSWLRNFQRAGLETVAEDPMNLIPAARHALDGPEDSIVDTISVSRWLPADTFRRRVCELRIAGYSVPESAAHLDVPEWQVNRALRQVRRAGPRGLG